MTASTQLFQAMLPEYVVRDLASRGLVEDVLDREVAKHASSWGAWTDHGLVEIRYESMRRFTTQAVPK